MTAPFTRLLFACKNQRPTEIYPQDQSILWIKRYGMVWPLDLFCKSKTIDLGSNGGAIVLHFTKQNVGPMFLIQ